MKNEQLKTVKELSNIAKVSKPTIYNRIEKLKGDINKNDIDLYIKKIDDITYLTPKAQVYIYKSLGLEIISLEDIEEKETKNEKTSSTETVSIENKNKELDILKNTLESLEKQLEEKDKQIASLLETINMQAKTKALESAKANNMLDIETRIDENEDKENKHPSRWQRLKQFIKGE